MKAGSLFSGYGGLDMAVSQVFGTEPAWFSEIEAAPSKILAYHWPDVPNHGDITKIDWSTVEPVDVLAGGFPCQDVSLAGKRAGMKPETRSGLWTHMSYAIEQLRPRYVVAENVRGLLSAEADSVVEPCPWCLGDGSGEHSLRALGAVLADLAELGYDAEWCGLRAAAVGAPHGRFRIFVLARNTNRSDCHGWATAGFQGEAGSPARPTEDADIAAGGERRLAAPGQAESRWAWADAGGRGGASTADATHDHRDGRADSRATGWRAGDTASNADHAGCEQHRRPVAVRAELAATEYGGHFAPDTDGNAIREQPVTQSGRSGTALTGLAGADAAGCGASAALWGQYARAIQRWELTLGRTAPAPTEATAKGSQRLSPRFVEWMMGLPAGHVTGVPGLSRNEQLKALGNGVVPQQATAALRHMLEQLEAVA